MKKRSNPPKGRVVSSQLALVEKKHNDWRKKIENCMARTVQELQHRAT